jgi:putative restriction endonuclease
LAAAPKTDMLLHMAFGVFIHRTDSIYDDVPSERYQFPKQYLSRVQGCKDDWIIYLEPSKVKNTKGYFAVAKVQEIIDDPRHSDMHLAVIEPGTYLDFGDPVPFRDANAIVEQGLLNDQGKISGRAQAAVRPLSPADFARIVELGLGQNDDFLPRTDQDLTQPGFQDAQTPFEHASKRDRVSQLTNRVVRDRNFRKTVLRAYDERCAITGLRLINGGGRAEVEAAHIKPVEYDGPDIVSNGLALSGTAHWMFDRGLVGLADDLTILVSRQSNNPSAVETMINASGKLLAPVRLANRPRAEFLAWHREKCFKA